jgi:hypothetical protein
MVEVGWRMVGGWYGGWLENGCKMVGRWLEDGWKMVSLTAREWLQDGMEYGERIAEES